VFIVVDGDWVLEKLLVSEAPSLLELDDIIAAAAILFEDDKVAEEEEELERLEVAVELVGTTTSAGIIDDVVEFLFIKKGNAGGCSALIFTPWEVAPESPGSMMAVLSELGIVCFTYTINAMITQNKIIWHTMKGHRSGVGR
jgi:hypothetical protein